jgi:hypothetical protein
MWLRQHAKQAKRRRRQVHRARYSRLFQISAMSLGQTEPWGFGLHEFVKLMLTNVSDSEIRSN